MSRYSHRSEAEIRLAVAVAVGDGRDPLDELARRHRAEWGTDE